MNEANSASTTPRRPYTTPTLVVYGDVRHLTAGGTQNMDEDAMAMSTNKP